VGGARRIDMLEEAQTAATLNGEIDDRLWDVDLVH
jgi:hypothetical protein